MNAISHSLDLRINYDKQMTADITAARDLLREFYEDICLEHATSLVETSTMIGVREDGAPLKAGPIYMRPILELDGLLPDAVRGKILYLYDYLMINACAAEAPQPDRDTTKYDLEALMRDPAVCRAICVMYAGGSAAAAAQTDLLMYPAIVLHSGISFFEAESGLPQTHLNSDMNTMRDHYRQVTIAEQAAASQLAA